MNETRLESALETAARRLGFPEAPQRTITVTIPLEDAERIQNVLWDIERHRKVDDVTLAALVEIAKQIAPHV